MKPFIVYLFLFSVTIFSQQQEIEPILADYGREVKFEWYPFHRYIGANSLITDVSLPTKTYSRYDSQRWYAHYQWNFPTQMIPVGSTIDYVDLTFFYSSEEGSYRLFANDVDITEPDLDYVYSIEITNHEIGEGTAPLSGWESINSNEIPGLISAVEDAIISNRLNLILLKLTGVNLFGKISSPKITIKYTPPEIDVAVYQKLSTGISFGNVAHYENLAWEDYQSGYVHNFGEGTIHSLQAATNIYSGEKFNNWNSDLSFKNYEDIQILPDMDEITANFKPISVATLTNIIENCITPQSGEIGFKDPWYRDFNDTKGLRNRGMDDAVWHYQTSFNLNSLSTYQGVFLNQSYNIPGQPYYLVHSSSPQNISLGSRTHKFYWQGWEGTNVSFESINTNPTAVVFTNTNAEVKAILKGVQLSNNTSGFQHGGQKKYAASFDLGGLENFYNVYESMGDVWLEYSDDSNNNWDLFREDRLNPYASWSQAKSPSLEIFNDSGTNYIYVVYQERTSSGGYNLILKKFDKSAVQKFSEVIYESSNSYSSHDATPVLSISKENSTTKLMVVWKEVNNGTYTDGLYFRGGTDVNHDMVWQSSTPTKITYTGSASLYPTIDSEKDYGTSPYFHLAWQENNAIKYLFLYYPNNIHPSGIETVSSGSSFYYHEKPSITVKNTSGIGEPIVVWYVDESAVQMRIRSTSGRWSAFYSYLTADDIGGVNISNNPVDELDYSFVWSEMLGYYNKIVKSSNLTSVSNIGTQGKSVQVAFYSYHVGFEDLAAVNSFSNQYGASLPYAFNTAMLDNTSEKVNTVAMSEGRTGCVIKDDAEFHFTFGDVLLDGSKIEFVTLPDTVDVSTTSVLNQYLMTDPFTVASNSSLLYSVIYGVNDSLIAANNLNENEEINFRVELVDDVTNETIGTFDNITQKKSSIIERENISYQVDLSGLENRTIKLRLVEEDNSVFGYSLAHVYATDTVLTKKNFQQLMWDGKAPVESYALSQNYPNPFNPSTTINYQIPRDGAVKLVIYDALGREVRTLVNEFKTKGRYEEVFNANDLASGVYIYHLKVNDFVQTRKMMLLK